MKIILLMAGAGRRFVEEGYTVSKPMLPVPQTPKSFETIPMFHAVLNNVLDIFKDVESISEIVILKKKECEINLPELDIPIKVIDVEKVTEGALCTALLAEKHLKTNQPILIINSDQLIFIDKINFKTFYNLLYENENFLFSFVPSDNSEKWSFAKLDEFGFVEEVAEKQKISDIATCGLYYFSSGFRFLEAADKMIKNNIRFNNEFYIAPIYNQFNVNARNFVFNVDFMVGLGTPQDYQQHLLRLGTFYNQYDNIYGVYSI